MIRSLQLVALWLATQLPFASASSQVIEDAESVRCVSLTRIARTEVIDDRHIAFYLRGGDILVNRLPRECRSLARENRFSYRTSTGQLCSIDSITVLSNFGGGLSRGASCGLGRFIPADEDYIASLRGDEEPAEITVEEIEVEEEE